MVAPALPASSAATSGCFERARGRPSGGRSHSCTPSKSVPVSALVLVGSLRPPSQPPGEWQRMQMSTGVWIAERPDRVLQPDRHAGEPEGISRRLSHHRSPPRVARCDRDVVAAMAVVTSRGRVHDDSLTWLRARHEEELVLLHGLRRPSIRDRRNRQGQARRDHECARQTARSSRFHDLPRSFLPIQGIDRNRASPRRPWSVYFPESDCGHTLEQTVNMAARA